MWICLISVFPYLWLEMVYGIASFQLVPQYPTINGSVTLNIMGIMENIGDFTWYKGSKPDIPYGILSFIYPNSPIILRGPLFNDRFSAFNNGSLRIKDLRATDGGNYTVQLKKTFENLTVSLIVYESVTKPIIIAFTTQLKENEVFTLLCTTEHAMTIRWTRNGAGIPSGSILFRDNRTLTFPNVKRGDAGEYRCEAQNLVSASTSDPYPVTVAYGPDMVHITSGRLHVNPGSSITLICSADSVPPPEYQWKHNGTDLKEKTNKYIISNAAPEDEGLYTCVVRNPVTLGTAIDSAYVNVTTDIAVGTSGLSPIIIAGVVCGTAVSIVVILGVTYLLNKMYITPLGAAQRGKQDESEIYENVADLPPKMNDSFYADLQYKSENVYNIIIR
ncbi:carcinoembryonic antigen-related cell adhesion molecule 6-like [Ranitomeya imitator]|uniref:carcinoembryonic antigen-related cell adhesion molecule 6-like n=1 Tax=Ranitomeya imitator TaxID=111125 RepID=UPI0037E819CE